MAELAVYMMVGSVRVAGQTIEAGPLAQLSSGSELRLETGIGAELVIIGGDPLDAPIHRYGPFVMNSRADLERAVRDYQSGRMGALRPTEAS